jgi:hypothetical protein
LKLFPAASEAEGATAVDDKDMRIAELEAQVRDLTQTMGAWFDTRKRAQEELGPILSDAMKGYLRTCRCGGMDTDESQKIEAAFDAFAESCTGDALFPIIRTLAEGLAARAE